MVALHSLVVVSSEEILALDQVKYTPCPFVAKEILCPEMEQTHDVRLVTLSLLEAEPNSFNVPHHHAKCI